VCPCKRPARVRWDKGIEEKERGGEGLGAGAGCKGRGKQPFKLAAFPLPPHPLSPSRPFFSPPPPPSFFPPWPR